MRRLRRTSSASRPRCSPVSCLRTLEQEPAAALEHRRRPSAASFRASGMGPRQTRAGTLVRAAGVQAVSPAQRGRSGATRLDGASTRARCGSDEDYQPSFYPQILRKTQARRSAAVDRTREAHLSAFHSHEFILAEHGRAILPHADGPADSTWGVHLGEGARGALGRVHRHVQREPPAVRVDQISQARFSTRLVVLAKRSATKALTPRFMQDTTLEALIATSERSRPSPTCTTTPAKHWTS